MLNCAWVRMAYFFMGLGLIGSHIAAAQPPREAADRKVLSFWEVVVLQRYRVASNLEDRPGHLGFYDSELQIARSQLTPIGVLKLGAAYTYTHFDFAGDTDLGLLTSAPFETAHDARALMQFTTRLHPRWTVRLLGSIGTRLESGASVDDALYGQVGMGFSYKVSEHFSIGPGFIVRASFADDATAFPLALVDWQITDRLSFRARRDFRLSYVLDANRTLTLSAVGSPFERKQFRLDDDGPVPGGIAELKAITVGAAFRWQPIQPLTVKGNISAVIDQRLTLEDRSGRDVVDEDLKDSVELMMSVRYRF